MSSCHAPSSPAVTERTIALAGNPNSGKTTLFNALTGLRQKVANYPGVTVEKKVGRLVLADGRGADLIDLPGTYSLIARSLDEQIAAEVLRGVRPDMPAPDVVLCVIDATNLQRNFYLLSQLIELRRPLVVALTMTDLAARRGLRVSASRLSRELGVPVVAVAAHRGEGLEALREALERAAVPPVPRWSIPEPLQTEIDALASALGALDGQLPRAPGASCGAVAERLLIGDRAPDISAVAENARVSTLVREAEQRLAQAGVDPMQADIEAHYRWIEQVTSGALSPACEDLLPEPAVPGAPGDRTMPPAGRWQAAPQPSAGAAAATIEYRRPATRSERLDAILLHRLAGLAIFALLMAGLFISIFWIADPIMGAVEDGIGALGSLFASLLPAGPLKDLWTDGIVAGVGGVLVFVPQIAILFGLLAALEDSGYLARAAFLMDRLLARVGLSGKSFIPMLSGFACAIPGIMATRTIEDRRARLATIFVLPFMSCSARLPVYALLIGAFFATHSAWTRGGLLLGLYALGIVAAVATALLFRRRGGEAGAFILELPPYRLPRPGSIGRAVWTNTWAFVSKAGTIIFCLSVVLWAMTYYPRLPAAEEAQLRALTARQFAEAQRLAAEFDADTPVESGRITVPRNEPGQPEYPLVAMFDRAPNQPPQFRQTLDELAETTLAAAQLRHSFAGRLGHAIEPAIEPLGFDWKIGVGLVGAFAAREVFVSTMGIVYAAGAAEEDDTSLREAMARDRRPDGAAVWTPLVAASLLVWFVIAMQCMSTLAIVRRETGGWRWPVLQLAYMNGLAYALSLAVYQVGSRL